MKQIVIAQPKFEVQEQCPNCNEYINNVKRVRIRCGACRYHFIINLNQKKVKTYLKDVLSLFGEHNQISLQADINNADYVTTLKQILDKIKKNYRFLDVGETEEGEDTTKKRSCKNCGYCKEEFWCNQCKLVFHPKTRREKGKIYTTYACIRCGTTKIKQFWFDKFAIKNKKKRCPHCAGQNVANTIFFLKKENEEVCPRCGSNKLFPPQTIKIVKATINMHKRYWNNG